MNTNTIIKTQVLILGAGPGGYSAAFRCADLGMKTVLVERYSNLGGVCLNVGCIPSKALLHIAKLIKINKELKNYSTLSSKNINDLDINKIQLWKNNIINKLSKNLNSMTKIKNIDVIHGFGKFIDNHTLQVTNNNNQTSSNIIFEHAIIATGSRSIPMPLPNIPNDHRIWYSTDALLLSFIPTQLLIIGSGSIGLEMAIIYHALGSKIDLVETYSQIMPALDEDISRIFFKHLNKKNINCILNTTINAIQSKQDGIYVTMYNNLNTQKKYTNRYDAILIAIGRSPNTNTLNLENIGININKNNFITVNKQMRTQVPNIFAIGDIIGYPMLAHKSIHEGYIASEVISGKKYFFDPKVIPFVVYTDPEIAWAGCSEKEAQSKNINYEVTIFPWTSLGKAIVDNCTEGVTKLIFEKKTRRIIGGAIIGCHASEIIGEIALSIEMGCDIEDITLTIHAHPTLYESISLAASIYNNQPTININDKNKILF